MSGQVVYRPTPSTEHVCQLPTTGDEPNSEPPGAVFKCDCSRHWIVSNETDGCAPPTYRWKRVRWWNLEAQDRIRAASHPMRPGMYPLHVGDHEGP